VAGHDDIAALIDGLGPDVGDMMTAWGITACGSVTVMQPA